jgi:hypothetical protein
MQAASFGDQSPGKAEPIEEILDGKASDVDDRHRAKSLAALVVSLGSAKIGPAGVEELRATGNKGRRGMDCCGCGVHGSFSETPGE